jgi:hypothetical protein
MGKGQGVDQMTPEPAVAPPQGSTGTARDAWLRALRRYIGFAIVANLLWEFAHLPLYTIWKKGTAREITFAAVHCTGGDVLITTAALMLALLIAGASWPIEPRAYRLVAVLTLAFGVSYTLFSEWLNIVVRKSWAYSELMPIIPIVDAGLSPVLQWIAIPLAAFWWVRRPLALGGHAKERIS